MLSCIKYLFCLFDYTDVVSPIWRVVANILNKRSQTAEKVWSSSLVVG